VKASDYPDTNVRNLPETLHFLLEQILDPHREYAFIFFPLPWIIENPGEKLTWVPVFILVSDWVYNNHLQN
jgi:hypothetical protein